MKPRNPENHSSGNNFAIVLVTWQGLSIIWDSLVLVILRWLSGGRQLANCQDFTLTLTLSLKGEGTIVRAASLRGEGTIGRSANSRMLAPLRASFACKPSVQAGRWEVPQISVRRATWVREGTAGVRTGQSRLICGQTIASGNAPPKAPPWTPAFAGVTA